LPKWEAVADIFRILAPTIMVFAISNPLGWLINALGLVKRSLLISLVSVPLLIAGVAMGLSYGPKGVAAAYSAVTLAKGIPIAWWALHGTGIRASEVLLALVRPLAASIAAGGIAYAGHVLYGPILPLVPRLLADLILFSTVYLTALLFVAGQSSLYVDLLRAVKLSVLLTRVSFRSSCASWTSLASRGGVRSFARSIRVPGDPKKIGFARLSA
jgi:O-antigen/teichoic acid export membrane protein